MTSARQVSNFLSKRKNNFSKNNFEMLFVIAFILFYLVTKMTFGAMTFGQLAILSLQNIFKEIGD